MKAKPLAQHGPNEGAEGSSPNSQGTRASRHLPDSPLILSAPSSLTLQKQRTPPSFCLCNSLGPWPWLTPAHPPRHSSGVASPGCPAPACPSSHAVLIPYLGLAWESGGQSSILKFQPPAGVKAHSMIPAGQEGHLGTPHAEAVVSGGCGCGWSGLSLRFPHFM